MYSIPESTHHRRILAMRLDCCSFLLLVLHSKQQVWTTITTRFLHDPRSLTYDHLRVSALPPVQIHGLCGVSLRSLVACTVLTIWRADTGIVSSQAKHFGPMMLPPAPFAFFNGLKKRMQLDVAPPLLLLVRTIRCYCNI
ncbi:hypothetical protein BX666DRAFT_152513 [Dichotomocladium elegans]|nr:hypothetical protein BX666DRAFT_152513 [Dichotomocladium elegans]